MRGQSVANEDFTTEITCFKTWNFRFDLAVDSPFMLLAGKARPGIKEHPNGCSCRQHIEDSNRHERTKRPLFRVD